MAQMIICLQCRRPRFHLLSWKDTWRREWLPTPVFLPGESHGQRSLVGYSPWGRRVGHDWLKGHHLLAQSILIFRNEPVWVRQDHRKKKIDTCLFMWLRRVLLEASGIFAVALHLSDCIALPPEPGRSVIVAQGLSCSMACGIFVPWPEFKPVSPALHKADS